MRIVCPNGVDEFLEALTPQDRIFKDIIRLSIHRIPQDGKHRFDATKFKVVLQASTVVLDGEDQFILETGVNCGLDYEDASQEKAGTRRAEAMKKQVVEFATGRGWRVLPGIIDM